MRMLLTVSAQFMTSINLTFPRSPNHTDFLCLPVWTYSSGRAWLGTRSKLAGELTEVNRSRYKSTRESVTTTTTEKTSNEACVDLAATSTALQRCERSREQQWALGFPSDYLRCRNCLRMLLKNLLAVMLGMAAFSMTHGRISISLHSSCQRPSQGQRMGTFPR